MDKFAETTSYLGQAKLLWALLLVGETGSGSSSETPSSCVPSRQQASLDHSRAGRGIMVQCYPVKEFMPNLLTPMFKFYPQDYLMKTAALTLEEQAALMRLIAFCWTGSIRKATLFDPAGMARLLGGISEKKALRLAENIHQFFTPSEEDPEMVVPNVPWIERTKTRPSMI